MCHVHTKGCNVTDTHEHADTATLKYKLQKTTGTTGCSSGVEVRTHVLQMASFKLPLNHTIVKHPRPALRINRDDGRMPFEDLSLRNRGCHGHVPLEAPLLEVDLDVGAHCQQVRKDFLRVGPSTAEALGQTVGGVADAAYVVEYDKGMSCNEACEVRVAVLCVVDPRLPQHLCLSSTF